MLILCGTPPIWEALVCPLTPCLVLSFSSPHMAGNHSISESNYLQSRFNISEIHPPWANRADCYVGHKFEDPAEHDEPCMDSDYELVRVTSGLILAGFLTLDCYYMSSNYNYVRRGSEYVPVDPEPHRCRSVYRKSRPDVYGFFQLCLRNAHKVRVITCLSFWRFCGLSSTTRQTQADHGMFGSKHLRCTEYEY